MNNSINSLVQSHCSHIQHPFTLDEICQQIQSGEYNAELLLQHLLLFVKGRVKGGSALKWVWLSAPGWSRNHAVRNLPSWRYSRAACGVAPNDGWTLQTATFPECQNCRRELEQSPNAQRERPADGGER